MRYWVPYKHIHARLTLVVLLLVLLDRAHPESYYTIVCNTSLSSLVNRATCRESCVALLMTVYDSTSRLTKPHFLYSPLIAYTESECQCASPSSISTLLIYPAMIISSLSSNRRCCPCSYRHKLSKALLFIALTRGSESPISIHSDSAVFPECAQVILRELHKINYTRSLSPLSVESARWLSVRTFNRFHILRSTRVQ